MDHDRHDVLSKVPAHLVLVHPDNVKSKEGVIFAGKPAPSLVPRPKGFALPARRSKGNWSEDIAISLKRSIFKRRISWTSTDMIHKFTRCSLPSTLQIWFRQKAGAFTEREDRQLDCSRSRERNQERQPWYGPSEKLPDQPLIDAPMNTEFDTLVVNIPSARNNAKGTSKDGTGSKG